MITFGDYSFDEERRQLSRGGETVKISPKAFQLLHGLLAAAPKALSKKELYDQLWGETFVEEVNLANLVSELRATLGDDRKNPRFIRTLHGFGYRFEASVSGSTPAAATPAGPTGFHLLWGKQVLPLREGENIVGRDLEAQVRIESAGVSRRHARIDVTGTLATIEDLGSKNGTFVGDERVIGTAPLHDGDLVRFGSAAMALRAQRDLTATLTELEATGPR